MKWPSFLRRRPDPNEEAIRAWLEDLRRQAPITVHLGTVYPWPPKRAEKPDNG